MPHVTRWSFEKCAELAAGFTNKTDFRKAYPGAYRKAWEYEWLEDITAHFDSDRPHGVWRYEDCLARAELCASKREFYARFRRAYKAAQAQGWLDRFDFEPPKSGVKWTREALVAQARRYESLYDFRTQARSAYVVLATKPTAWKEEAYAHFPPTRRRA